MNSSRIDAAQVRHIAKLSRLKLSDEQVQLFCGQLGRIVDYVRQLQQVNTQGVEPLAHPLPISNVMRDDEPHSPLDAERALQNAPQRAGDLFKVPPMLDPLSGGA